MLDVTVQTLLDGLASRKPLPAGGAAAVVAGAAGAALGLKVVRISMNEHPESGRLRAAEARLERILEELTPRYDEDCAAFESVLAARRLDPPDRNATSAAWRTATTVPVRVLRLARDGLLALLAVVHDTRRVLRCDHMAAASLLWTAAEISTSNAVSNAASLPTDGAVLAQAARDAHGSAHAAYHALRAGLDV